MMRSQFGIPPFLAHSRINVWKSDKSPSLSQDGNLKFVSPIPHIELDLIRCIFPSFGVLLIRAVPKLRFPREMDIANPLYPSSVDPVIFVNLDARSRNPTLVDTCHEIRRRPLPKPPRPPLKRPAGLFPHLAETWHLQKPTVRISTRKSVAARRVAIRLPPYTGPWAHGNLPGSQVGGIRISFAGVPPLWRKSRLLSDYEA